MPLAAGMRILQTRTPLDEVFLLCLLYCTTAGYEYWSLARRQARSAAGPFLPAIGALGFIVVLLRTHPSSVIWAPSVVLFAFIRMRRRHAMMLSVAVGVASLAILQFHWQVDAYWVVRTAIAMLITFGAIRIFFDGLADTLGELERTGELLDSSVQAMTQGIMIAGADGRVKVYNEAAREMLGLSPEMMRDHPKVQDLRACLRRRGDLDTRPGTGPSAGSGRPPSPDGGKGAGEPSWRETSLFTRHTTDGRYLQVQTVNTPAGDAIRTYTDVTNYELINRQLSAVLQDYGEMRRREMGRAREQLIAALSLLSRFHDDDTGEHVVRTQLYLRVLAQALVQVPGWSGLLTADVIERIVKASPMHDLGKIGVPDNILKKPGRLSPEEMAVMRTHAAIGESTLSIAATGAVEDRSLLQLAARIAGAHHENWDGSGYPKGLIGTQIPPEARLMALADVYDALITARVYKPAWTHEQAAAEIRRQRAIKFDPDVVDAFEREQLAFRAIAQAHRDPVPEADAA